MQEEKRFLEKTILLQESCVRSYVVIIENSRLREICWGAETRTRAKNLGSTYEENRISYVSS